MYSLQGQEAKARLGFAGVASVRDSLDFTVEKRKRIQELGFFPLKCWWMSFYHLYEKKQNKTMKNTWTQAVPLARELVAY